MTTAPLSELPRLLAEDPSVVAVASGRSEVVAVSEAARALFTAGIHRLTGAGSILLAVPTAAEAERLAGDLVPMLGADAVELFPAWETLPFERVSPALETMGRRLRIMWRLREGGDRAPAVVVAPVRALVQRLGPHVEDIDPIVLRKGDQIDRDDLLERLVAAGYRREYQVEGRGEIAVRGSIVDVYPSTADHPVRVDLWGDEIDRLSVFSVADQRSNHELRDVMVFPSRELLPTPEVADRARKLIAPAPWGRAQWERLGEGQIFDGMESWLPWLTEEEHLLPDLLPAGARVLLVEPRRMRDRAQELLDEEANLAETLSGTWGAEGHEFPRLSLPFERLLAHTKARATSLLASPDSPDTPQLAAAAFDPVVGDVEALAGRIRALRDSGTRVVIATEGTGSASRLRDVLAGEGVQVPITEAPSLEPGSLSIVVAPLERGVVMPGAGLALIAEADLTGRRRVHRRPREARKAVDYYEDLKPGDFVVHQVHGVGRYEGMVARGIGGVERDYLLLAYRGGDKLYVPTDQVGTIRRYTGGDSPSLSKMGGTEWQKTRGRVRSAVQEVAAELVILYRQRLAAPGFAFSPDTPWQREMEDSFPYEETPDQLQAITDVKADMEQPIPMDRLICGDVGYGKTEVAMRAAFKAVQDGKQVVVLAPTTLLANQHGQTFRERFAGYPVRVEVLSRFLSQKEQKAIVADVARGAVDVIIGTHRLLSDDVKLKDQGLLVIDEEQRFGVQHKEKIKRLRANVDVLTLTATPIPRTLEMSLTGIRDLSLVQTPPEERQPILTYVGEYDERAVSEAIRRELLREGQVFYVHNRVQDIEHVAAQVAELVPGARIAIAHGQMDESRLERVVLDFAARDYDVMVCTTIIESGLDMPTVNTMVVDRADLLGLAQLYQLRGRVGRRGQRAVRVPAASRGPGAERRGVRTPQGDRRVHRPGLRLQARHARPRDPRRRQPARRGAERAHRGGRLRSVLRARDRGRQRAEGGDARGALRRRHRRAGGCAPAARVRQPGRRADGGIPAAGGGHRSDRRRRRPQRVARPLRPAPAQRRGTPRGRAAAGRGGADPGDEHLGPEGRRPDRGPRAQGEPEGAPAPARTEGRGQGGRRGRDPAVGPVRRGARHPGRAAARARPRGARGPRGRVIAARAGRVPIPVKRTFSLLAVAVAAALVLSACSSTAGPAAAKVDSTTISRKTVNDDLKAMTDNKAVTAMLSKSLSTNVKPTNGGVSIKLATLWVTTLVNQAAVDQYFAKHHLKITAADKSAAKSAAYSSFVNKKTFQQLPRSFQDAAIARQERIAAVQRILPKPAPPSDAVLQQTLTTQGATLCPSGQVVAQIQSKTEADANAIEAQLAAGADFGTLAAKSSTDTGSGAVGGLVACTASDQYNQLPASFRLGSDPLKPGQTSAPVHTEFGWHVIRVEPFDFANARLLLISILQQQEATPLTKFVNSQLLKRHVWVDPRYGRVNRTKAVITIVPPTAPNPKSEPAEPTTTTKPAAAATGQ